MKNYLNFKRWMLLLLLLAGASGAMAQVNQDPTQEVCIGTEPYYVDPGNPTNTFLWTIDTGTPNVDWIITNEDTPSITVQWITPGIYNLSVTETSNVPISCSTTQTVQVTVYPGPSVNAGPDQVICALNTVSLNGSMGGSATSITWSTSGTGTFDDAGSLTAIYTPSAADIVAGTVTLTITTDDPVGPCGAATDDVVITIDPSPTADAGPDQVICEGSAVTMAGAIGGAATSLLWTSSGSGTFDDPTSLTAIYTPSAADITTGTVTLTITTDDPVGLCDAATDFMIVTINPAATADAGPDQTICEGSTVLLAGVIGGSATSSTWTSSGTGTFDDPASLTAIYTPSAADITAGTVTLTLTTDDPAGICDAATDFLIITIDPAPVADAGPDQVICEGSTVTMAGSISGAATLLTWTTNGSGTFDDPTSLTAIYTPSAADITAGTVTLTITTDDPVGLCDAATDFMIVTINPAATADAGPDQTICEGSTVLLAGVIGGSATSSTWTSSGTGTFDDPASLTAIYTPSVADITAGTVTLTLTTDDPAGICDAATDFMIVTIDPAPTADAGPDQNVCEGSTILLAGTIGGAATSVTWTSSGTGTFDDPTSLTATYTPSAADIAAGTVTLTMTTNDPVGLCDAATDTMIITIDPAATVDAGPDQTTCSDTDVVLNGTIGGAAVSATWTTSGTGTFDDVNLLTATYTLSAADIAAGTVTLTLTTNDPAGVCDPAVDTMVITITPAPTTSPIWHN